MLNGKSGAIGPNAQHLVARGPNSGPELAVKQPLGATKPVLAIPQRLDIAQHLYVQVFPFPVFLNCWMGVFDTLYLGCVFGILGCFCYFEGYFDTLRGVFGKETLPEAQRTQKLTTWLGLNLATTWHHLHMLQIWPPDGATCISCKVGHQMTPHALVANLATRWRHLH